MLNVTRGHIYWGTGNTLAGAIVGTKAIDICLFVFTDKLCSGQFDIYTTEALLHVFFLVHTYSNYNLIYDCNELISF